MACNKFTIHADPGLSPWADMNQAFGLEQTARMNLAHRLPFKMWVMTRAEATVLMNVRELCYESSGISRITGLAIFSFAWARTGQRTGKLERGRT